MGYKLSELENCRFMDFVHPDDIPGTLEAISDLSHQKAVLNFTNRYRCKDGSYRWIEWRSHLIGKMIYAVARDITEHKRTEELRVSPGGVKKFGEVKISSLRISPSFPLKQVLKKKSCKTKISDRF